ncbi:helix-turn-helix transcriptional regulator [Mycobacterium vulneris]|jgi:DNA-binding CsgD family transcriptional regulator|uniref:Helix-turn-helix transcriptional regulator n=2 Tax=Mycolicibacterium vulneris TaxID=547163 RepID=A0A1X2LEA5_9MYCO|nr:helix-turn-helix transcriptional regulator [Mycolicibacterium vulneris]
MSVSFARESNRISPGGRTRTEWWSTELELIDRLTALRDRANATLGRDIALPTLECAAPARSAEAVSILTHACIERLRDTPGHEVTGARQLCDLVLQLQQLAMDLYLHQTAMRSRRLADCAAGLSRLRGVPSSTALMEGACEELVARCGFHRAVISKLENRSWKPLILHNRDDNSAPRSWFSEWANQRVPLSATAPEAELVSRRRPSMVYDTADAPVYRPLIVQAGQSRSYVLAPLVHGEEVIGFLHTDHHPLPRRVDEADRDVLWAFADGFTHIYDRAVLMERLQVHRNSVRELFFGTVDRIDDLCGAGLDVSQFGGHSDTAAGKTTALSGPVSRPAVELSEREAEVFDLMVTGASNQEIADRLVITEGTVKSHVKHILRKYGAVNRAQAIAWALSER